MMDIAQDKTGLTLVMGSSLEQIDCAEDAARTFLKQSGHEGETFAVCLAMREGLTNAVRHGNRFVEAKRITLRLRLRQSLLRMEIEDQGDGFDWRAFMIAAPSPDADHGHGLEIMRRYFNRLDYNDKGNILILEKTVGEQGGIDAPQSLK